MKDITLDFSNEELLKAENEMLKLKIELEHGGNFFDSGETSDIPEEVKNQWLQNVYNFESIYKTAPKIMVYERIQRPVLFDWHSLTSQQQEHAIDDLLEILYQNQICFFYDPEITSDEEAYTYILENVLNEEILDYFPEGSFVCFMYEEPLY